jgi:RNA polymerase sigma-70 factor (ECF subfamily)
VEVRLTSAQAATLGNLWQLHSGALHIMLAGWCGDAQMASDVLQEVFRRLAGSPALMDQMNNARAFLAVSARRIAVDFARRSATRSAYHTAAGAEAPSAENPGPTDAALREAIAKALESLPAEQRVAFEHKVLNGRTLDEISKLEKISLNTAASRLRYALDKIRGQLRPYYDDLNRKDFKNMKNNPSNTEDIASQRIITPLAPKRVPSVAPGLEGLAAMAPDACEAAPEIAAFEPDFVEALPAAELVEPAIAYCWVGGNAWEASLPEAVELPATDAEGSVSEGAEEATEFVVSEEMPEMISCEILPELCGIPEEWLRPIVCELPEDFFVTVFEGEIENSVDGLVDGEFGEGEAIPFGLEEGFETYVLPVPEEFSSSLDPQELLVRYEEFLREDPNWLAGLSENQGDWFHEQVTTASAYFEKLEFGTPGEANAFDHWFASNLAAANTTGEEGADYGGEQPDYADDSWSFDPKDLLVRYEDFLRENPYWGSLDPDMMEIQVVTPSSYFGEIEFGTPSKASDFDNWYVNVYSQDAAYGSINLGGAGDGEYGTVVSDNLYSGGKDFLETTGVITDTRNGQTGIPAEWMRGGTVDQTDGNTLTLSNGSKVVLEGGQVVSGENVYAYNPEFGSVSLPSSDAQLGAVDLPTEIAITGGAVAEAALPFGNVAAGLAPTPNQALIVEFGVLSPSEPLQAPQMQAALHASDDLPQSMVSSSGVSTDTSGADAALPFAVDDSAPDSALPYGAASAQETGPASNTGIKVDAPTAAAGAVAAGTVVHGGAAAPALRRPLPTL